ncbi:hypothetical protein [Microbacterium kyungheense]|uniref:Uncharacterized protein n=1 Tax=Microbacterium kyungheense TaxID=1263636 RepID=A0A543F0K2_9MICO|nr:hypothetical protein [Microbacterium kyungheense]TQM27361.1 hypothetical protein FB391_1373 [Microbacterium kyungheense]
MPATQSPRPRTSSTSRTAFWVVAALGPLSAAIAWFWYGFAQAEAQSEQGKALAAGTTMAGFAEVVGGIPLVLAHIVGVGLLVTLGWFGYRGRGIALALGAVLVASLIGVGVAQLTYGGELFDLGIGNDTFVP